MFRLIGAAAARREQLRRRGVDIAFEARVRLLSAELDQSRQSALERTRTTDTKASLLIVAAGVIASMTGTSLVDASTWYLGLVPLAYTVAAVVLAVVALWPRKLSVPSGPQMVAAWVYDDLTPAELEDRILEVKSREVAHRDEQNDAKAEWTRDGFVMLLAALVSAFIVIALDATTVK